MLCRRWRKGIAHRVRSYNNIFPAALRDNGHMNTIATTSAAQAQQEIAEEFAFFGDWTERYQYLTTWASNCRRFPNVKTEENRARLSVDGRWCPAAMAPCISEAITIRRSCPAIALVLRVYSDRPTKSSTPSRVHRHDRAGQTSLAHRSNGPPCWQNEGRGGVA